MDCMAGRCMARSAGTQHLQERVALLERHVPCHGHLRRQGRIVLVQGGEGLPQLVLRLGHLGRRRRHGLHRVAHGSRQSREPLRERAAARRVSLIIRRRRGCLELKREGREFRLSHAGDRVEGDEPGSKVSKAGGLEAQLPPSFSKPQDQARVAARQTARVPARQCPPAGAYACARPLPNRVWPGRL